MCYVATATVCPFFFFYVYLETLPCRISDFYPESQTA